MELKQYNILLVSEDGLINQIIDNYLDYQNFKVTIENRITFSFTLANCLSYDAILIYIADSSSCFPEKEVLGYLRTIDEHIPILIITPTIDSEIISLGLNFTIDDFIVTPSEFKFVSKLILFNILKRKKLISPSLSKNAFKVIFENLLIISESKPVYANGLWDNLEETDSYDIILLSGFVSAIQSYSKVLLNQKIVELSFGSHKLLFYQHEKTIACLSVSKYFYESLHIEDQTELIELILKSILNEIDYIQKIEFNEVKASINEIIKYYTSISLEFNEFQGYNKTQKLSVKESSISLE